jgi:hypothetical protein
VTVNWRDIKATIHHKSLSSKRSPNTEKGGSAEQSEDEEEIPATSTDPENDTLKWLDDGLPDLSGFQHRYFDLATHFDISRYIDILADSVPNGAKAKTGSGLACGRVSEHKTQEGVEANSLAPQDSEWGSWA